MSLGKQHEQYLWAGLIFVAVFSAALLVDADAQQPPPANMPPTQTPLMTSVAEPRPSHAPKKASSTKPAYVSPPANCKEAWERGIAPIYRGDPNYTARMDGDDDGIACEPYHGKRY